MADDPTTPQPRSPAPAIHPVHVFPTPDKRDLLFFVEVDARLPKYKPGTWTYGDAYRDAVKYPNHKLVYVSQQTEQNWERRYYAASRADQDNYNFEFSSADMGGRRFPTVNRTYLSLRADFNATAPAAGAAMPVGPDNKFDGLGYVLMGRVEQRTGDETLDSIFVAETYSYVQKSSTVDIGVDPLNGRPLAKTTTFYYATEANVGGTGLTAAALFAASTNSYWGIQSSGYQRSGQQISADWYVIDAEQVIAGTASGGGLIIAEYETTENHYWPPVLDTLEPMDWERRDGGEDIFYRILFDPEGYNGPCTARVTLTWKSTPFTGLAVDTMQPQRIYYGSPFFTLNVPECLHASLNVICDIGTSDPVYKQNTGSSRNFPATSPATRPASVIAVDDQKPYRGGYLRTTMEVDEP